MQRAIAILPRVNTCPRARPIQCPYYECGILHKHGEVQKSVKDIYVAEVAVMRYLCVGCKRSFTHYPQGVDRNSRSVRLRALMWVLGATPQVGGMRTDGTGMPSSYEKLTGCARGGQGGCAA